MKKFFHHRLIYSLILILLLASLFYLHPGTSEEFATPAGATSLEIPSQTYPPSSTAQKKADTTATERPTEKKVDSTTTERPTEIQSTLEVTKQSFLPLITTGIPSNSGDRQRVKILNNNLVADNGRALRGEHIYLTDHPSSGDSDFALMYDINHWKKLRDDYHLNTVRLMASRPPQNWPGGPGNNCEPPIYRCYDFDYVFPNGRTTLEVIDDMVNIASQLGMYIIIDYHPVGGHDESDASDWWSQVAPRYADRTHVIYELANEPVAWKAENYDDADVAFQKKMYKLIRSYAPDSHIIMWSFANATPGMLGKVNEANGISYGNASVAYHPYINDVNAILALRDSYPVMNTEIGGSDSSQYHVRTQTSEDIGVSWIWLDGWQHFSPGEIYWPGDPGTNNQSSSDQD